MLGTGALLGVIGLWLFRPFPEECLQRKPPQSTVLLDRNGVPLRVFLGSDGSFSLWQPLEAFGEWLPKALIAAEDKRFYQHFGVDPISISRAICQNIIFMRRVSGASTLSTQVIRLAQPRPRVLSTKFLELFLATQMERCHTKEEILEQYLNRAPFGGNFIGAEAAARRYLGKRARDMTIAEAALLAGLPQSPTRHRPDLHPVSAYARRAYVLERMHTLGFITTEQYEEAGRAPLPKKLLPYPFLAPHFCAMIRRSWGETPQTGEIRTTLDVSMQQTCETALREHVASLLGVRGGAVLLLSTETREILAWVGSPNFFDSASAGQYDAVLSWRSPGSTLKPFAYALALEQGRITPETMVPDIPRQYLDFTPGNFDGKHHGVVSARAALVQSLNAPALDLVSSCGVDAFLDTLTAMGVSAPRERSRERNGLGAVLGNTEVRLVDLTSAYARLGSGIEKTPEGEPLSPEAIWITLEMLSGEERAEVETGSLLSTAKRRKTAWKTGTSAGFRDAWTMAVNPTFTVGVWLGNPDGHPSQALVGIEAASPLAFRILQTLPQKPADSEWFPRPEGIEAQAVCATSGMRPGPYCANRVETVAIRGVTQQRTCTVHSPDRDGDGVAEEHWPIEIETYRRAALEKGTVAERPTILSPAPNAVLRTGPLDAGGGKVPFRARAKGELFWFLDGAFLAQAPATEAVLWEPVPGKHVLRCCTATGESCDVSFVFER